MGYRGNTASPAPVHHVVEHHVTCHVENEDGLRGKGLAFGRMATEVTS